MHRKECKNVQAKTVPKTLFMIFAYRIHDNASLLKNIYVI